MDVTDLFTIVTSCALDNFSLFIGNRRTASGKLDLALSFSFWSVLGDFMIIYGVVTLNFHEAFDV